MPQNNCMTSDKRKTIIPFYILVLETRQNHKN